MLYAYSGVTQSGALELLRSDRSIRSNALTQKGGRLNVSLNISVLSGIAKLVPGSKILGRSSTLTLNADRLQRCRLCDVQSLWRSSLQDILFQIVCP